MAKLQLSKEKLIEIFQEKDDDKKMEAYYDIALKGEIVAGEHMAIVAFLLVLIDYKKRKMLSENMNPLHFFGVPQEDFKKLYELLELTNWEIFYAFTFKETIPDRPLVEFSEDAAFLSFWRNCYFESLRSCENALRRDANSFLCNFIKASIVEICHINKSNIAYKIQLTNYQKNLIDKCEVSKLNFNKEIFEKVVENIEQTYSTLDSQFHNINFTLAKDTFEETQVEIPQWTKEHDFCLRQRLFLNPLCNFDLFIESSLEELEDLQIEEKQKMYFDEIIDEYKLCRHLTYEYSENVNNDTKRIQCMVFSYAYSILDKLAFLFRDVYDIDASEDEIQFTQDKLFDRKLNGKIICFKNIKNSNIYPLYSIMQRVRSKQKITDAIKMVAFDFHNLRNTIEHKSILKIDENQLKSHSIFLLKNIRDAILYSFMLLRSLNKNNISVDDYSAIANTYVNAIVQLSQEQKVSGLILKSNWENILKNSLMKLSKIL